MPPTFASAPLIWSNFAVVAGSASGAQAAYRVDGIDTRGIQGKHGAVAYFLDIVGLVQFAQAGAHSACKAGRRLSNANSDRP
jgi:hypothetical protein